jgi:hypothetical protein
MSSPDWLHEIKHDGFRITAFYDILDEPDRRGWWHRI